MRVNDIMGTPHTRHTFMVQLPSTHNFIVGNDKIVRPCDEVVRNKVLDFMLDCFTKQFGGNTINEVVGQWTDSLTGETIKEQGTQVIGLSDHLTENDVLVVKNMALGIKALFNQDSVLVMIDGKGWFV